MEELKSIANQFEDLKEKRKLKDIKTCYSNITSINNLINRLNNISEEIIRNEKAQLIKIYQEEITKNIEVIIKESNSFFMENINDEDERDNCKNILLDIQKSSFYQEYKNIIKIKEMEIEFIMVEGDEDKDYKKAMENLINIDKEIFDRQLKKTIQEYINDCKISIINQKESEIRDLLNSKDFDNLFDSYEDLFRI